MKVKVATQKHLELLWLLDCAAAKQPRVIVEIGVDQGTTFHALEAACPDAVLIGIDIGGGKWSSGMPLDDPRVICGDSHDTETLVELRRRLHSQKIGFLLVDGDHSYDGVAQDYWSYLPLVEPGGLVALHDIAEHPASTGVHVHEFWRAVKHRHPDAVEYIDPPHDWGGYALFAKEQP